MRVSSCDAFGQRLACEPLLRPVDPPDAAALEHPLDDLGILGLRLGEQIDGDRRHTRGEQRDRPRGSTGRGGAGGRDQRAPRGAATQPSAWSALRCWRTALDGDAEALRPVRRPSPRLAASSCRAALAATPESSRGARRRSRRTAYGFTQHLLCKPRPGYAPMLPKPRGRARWRAARRRRRTHAPRPLGRRAGRCGRRARPCTARRDRC